MKGFLTLCSIFLAFLNVCFPAAADEKEIADTLERVIISAEKSPIAYTGLKRLDRKELIAGTAVLGTPDVIKVLQNISGVASGMELMSGLYVHGGDGSDNLFLLDGVPLFQVSHLAGLFSSFNTDIIQSADFYKSGFPARYGGKLSSVVDITTTDGSMEKFGGSVSIGLIDGRINLNGPIVKNKLSYNVAIRRSWLDAIIAPILAFNNSGSDTKTKGGYALFDSDVNLAYSPTKSDKINFRFFAGTDHFSYSKITQEKYYGKEIYDAESGVKTTMKWGNIAASSSWSHIFSQRLALSAMLYYSKGYSDISDWQKSNDFSDDVLTSGTFTETSASRANAAGIKSALVMSFKHHNLSAGIEYRSSWYNPSHTKVKTKGEDIMTDSGSGKYLSHEVSAFAEDEMTYGPFSLTAGLRLDGYFADGAAYFRPQPRLAASYNITDDIIAKASYEAMSQYAHLLSSIYIDLPTNIWMPSTSIVKPSDSHQAAAGYMPAFQRIGMWMPAVTTVQSGTASSIQAQAPFSRQLTNGRRNS